MFSKVKTQLEKTKRFAQEHPTVVVCAVTAVVSWKLSHDATLKGALDESTALAYEWGQKAGAMEVEVTHAWDFIQSKGLFDEFTNTSS